MVEQQRIIGIDIKSGNFVTSTELRGPTLMLIFEMYKLHKETNKNTFTFSYNHKKETSTSGVKEHVVGEWTPAQYKDTCCGQIARKADDQLKGFLKHLTNMRRVNDIAQQMYIPANFIVGAHFEVKLTSSISRICIEPREVILFSDSLTVKEVRWKINYSVFNLEGEPLPLSDSELNYVDDLEKNVIPTIIEKEPSHPFALFRDVVIAQYIAGFIIEKQLEHDLLFSDEYENTYQNLEMMNEPSCFVTYSTQTLKLWYAIEAHVGIAILAKLGTEEISKYYFLKRMNQMPDSWVVYNTVDEQSIEGMCLATGTQQVTSGQEGGAITKYDPKCLKYLCNPMKIPFFQVDPQCLMGKNNGTKIKSKDGSKISQDQEFINNIWVQEKSKHSCKSNGRCYATKPPEKEKGNGKPTCDYGPGLKLGCNHPDGFTRKEIDQMLSDKLNAIEDKLRKKCDYDSLSRYQKWLLVDFDYNLGDVFRKFPKFAQAVLYRDRAGMEAEYKRYFTEEKSGEKKPLVERNKWTMKVIQQVISD